MGENSFCPVCCRDVFKHPVLRTCSHHSQCINDRDVLKTLLAPLLVPPIVTSPTRSPTRPGELCSLHDEVLKLYCVDDQKPACIVCRDSNVHTKHRFKPIDEVALDHKTFVEKSLKLFQEKLEVFKKFKANYDQTAEHIKAETQNTERKINEQFKKLHQFLQKEEECRITALREEESIKTRMMKEKVDDVNKDISTLLNTINTIQEELTAESVLFLRNFQTIMGRFQLMLPEPQLVPGALIDQIKHLGNLTFGVWDKMKEMVSYSPVLLDPNTAHAIYTVSDDLTSVAGGKRRELPDNPERFDSYGYVLGSEGFNSGVHSWDVDVGNTNSWSLGLLEESFSRKGNRQGNFWRIRLADGEYSTQSSRGNLCVIPVKSPPQRIRVRLDWRKGKLTFSDPDASKDLHTFKHNFKDKLIPYFVNRKSLPMKMLPLEICVSVP